MISAEQTMMLLELTHDPTSNLRSSPPPNEFLVANHWRSMFQTLSQSQTIWHKSNNQRENAEHKFNKVWQLLHPQGRMGEIEQSITRYNTCGQYPSVYS